MERQRYEVTLRCGNDDSVFWTNRLAEVRPIIMLACSGAQSLYRMGLMVRDSNTNAHAEIYAQTSLGFAAAVDKLLDSLEATQPRPVRANEGRDVVVEVRFAAHNATLEQCKAFVAGCVEQGMGDFPGGASYSFNGELVGQAWFE